MNEAESTIKVDSVEEIKLDEEPKSLDVETKSFDDILFENSTSGDSDKKKESTVSNEISSSSDSKITDDQYFDDFFQDE